MLRRKTQLIVIATVDECRRRFAGAAQQRSSDGHFERE
jgi:hypothetical protein